MSNIVNEESPYNYQAEFDLISADVENSYIKQNLPIRRQSLIAYHDKMRSSNEPKRHSSLNIDTAPEKLHINTRLLSNSKSLNSVHIEPSEQNNQLRDTLKKQPLPEKQQVKFIGLLRPSKSDSTSMYKKKQESLSQSWNDMSQPLLKLKNVFSRLQPNNNTDEVLATTASTTATATETKAKTGQNPCSASTNTSNKEILKRKKKKSVVIEKVKKRHAGIIYTALLSHVSRELLKKLQLSSIVFKDGIEYHNVFNGTTAVSCILDILNTNDRNLSLLVGRALESQGFFHHINYDYKLRDSDDELYKFQYTHHDDSNYYDRPPIPPQFVSPNNNKLLSLKRNNNHKKHVPSVCETLPVNGIFSILTDCYSPTCTRKSPCYSISCPRMTTRGKKTVKRPLSSFLLTTDQEQLRSLWRHSVPLNIVMGTNGIEQKRQECIYELIYTEQDFTKDMHYVQNVIAVFWVDPIHTSDIIPIERRNEFITEVFWNLPDIQRITSALSKDLTARQDKHTVIPAVGDILLNHVKDFQPFVTYGEHQIIGKHAYELEKKRNPKFLQFAQKLERQPESRRLELNGYLTKPTSRLGRYNLLLNTIHQITPQDHQDHHDLPLVILKITELLVQLNKKVGLSDNTFHLEQISSKIIPAKGNIDLNLLDPKRQLIMCGKMKRFNYSSWDIQVFLFDHYLHQDGLENFKIYQKPIPLEELHVSIPNADIIPSPSSNKSFTTSNIYNKISSSPTTTTLASVGYPITFHHVEDSITLTTASESTRKLWIDKINEKDN
ncbi:hypothetical protein MFLAVUS_006362 [Mucor flavus]|uniref:DH domain-containing protein n=1 Tax=Mucor flavus TaxID=439312 RepID=A0ABP9Z1D8_9FUNG